MFTIILNRLTALSAVAVEYTTCSSAEAYNPLSTTTVLVMSLNHLMVRFQSGSFAESGGTLHCHYFHVHSDLEGYYPLGSHLWIR